MLILDNKIHLQVFTSEMERINKITIKKLNNHSIAKYISNEHF